MQYFSIDRTEHNYWISDSSVQIQNMSPLDKRLGPNSKFRGKNKIESKGGKFQIQIASTASMFNPGETEEFSCKGCLLPACHHQTIHFAPSVIVARETEDRSFPRVCPVDQRPSNVDVFDNRGAFVSSCRGNTGEPV